MNDERRPDEPDHRTDDVPLTPDDPPGTPDPPHPEQVDRYEPIPLIDDASDEPRRDDDSEGETTGTSDADAGFTAPPATTPRPSETADEQASPAAAAPEDRATRAGYPPDSGPEQDVMRIRPAFFRSHPLWVAGALVVPPVVAFAALWIGSESGVTWALWSGGVLSIAALFTLAGWWFIATRSRSIQITNKRTTEIRGLLSKSTDEVLHDHVRNVTVDQSVYERIVNTGTLGIASAGHAETEIVMRDLPNPGKIRDVIDLYRPVG